MVFSIFAFEVALAQRPLGTDVSGFQTNINWTTVKNAGIVFAWAKATEGTYYTNPLFASQEADAKSSGIYIGAYHYARPSIDTNITGALSADTEAASFWSVASNYVKDGGAYLIPMLDWEDVHTTNGYDGFNGFTAGRLSAWVNQWCNDVSNDAVALGVTGVRPVVYTGTWYSNPSNGYPGLNTIVTNWPDWIADYNGLSSQTGSPASTYPWPSWNLWQYWDTNASGGDADVFNGTLPGFAQIFIVGGTNAPIITNPTSLTVTPGGNATFSATATGQPPLYFHWLFDGVPIRGATSSSYAITNAQLTDAGNYVVVVSNSYAAVPASAAFLSVLGPLTNAPASVLDPPEMVNWWTADGNPNDICGTNNAVPNNGLSYTNGMVGQAFRFDGSTSYLTINGATNISPGWTICFWVNRQNAPGTSATLIGNGSYALKLEQYGNAARNVGISQSGVGDYFFIPPYTVPTGIWTHLAFVGTAASVSLYTNGVFEGETNVSNFPLPRNSLDADTFSGTQTDFMLGSLDEIQIFSRVLSSAEINSIWQAGSAGLVRAPEFTHVISTNFGQVQLSLRGQTGKDFTLYTSTNLTNWTLLLAIPNATGATNYSDSSASDLQKFYRVIQSRTDSPTL
ncbi:MAG TPA: GH25 family lysozyme [Candidatus Acidoferrum sp.]|nr:GH25 family lysozyme [Candidatus Acidoferrum sp.]